MRSLPCYALAGGGMGGSGMGMGMGALGVTGVGPSAGPRTTVSDRVPADEVEVRCGDRVQASDGAIGHVRGLAIDPSDQQVTHVLLDEGHLWGKKRVAIPISAVTRIDDDVQVNVTKDQVGDLPAVELDWLVRGLAGLELLERLALGSVLILVLAIGGTFAGIDASQLLGGGLRLPPVPRPGFVSVLLVLGGIVITVQGFETVRYLQHIDRQARIAGCRLS